MKKKYTTFNDRVKKYEEVVNFCFLVENNEVVPYRVIENFTGITKKQIYLDVLRYKKGYEKFKDLNSSDILNEHLEKIILALNELPKKRKFSLNLGDMNLLHKNIVVLFYSLVSLYNFSDDDSKKIQKVILQVLKSTEKNQKFAK